MVETDSWQRDVMWTLEEKPSYCRKIVAMFIDVLFSGKKQKNKNIQEWDIPSYFYVFPPNLKFTVSGILFQGE